MPASIVIVFVIAGFAAGLTTGVLAAYHLLVALNRIEAAISEAARSARPF